MSVILLKFLWKPNIFLLHHNNLNCFSCQQFDSGCFSVVYFLRRCRRRLFLLFVAYFMRSLFLLLKGGSFVSIHKQCDLNGVVCIETHTQRCNTCTVHTLQQRSYLLIFWIVWWACAMRPKHLFSLFSVHSQPIRYKIAWMSLLQTRVQSTYVSISFSLPLTYPSDVNTHTQLVFYVVLTTPLPSSARVHSYTHTNTVTQTHDDNPNEENKNENGGGKLALCSSSFMLIWFAVYHECSYIFTWCFACEQFWRVNN